MSNSVQSRPQGGAGRALAGALAGVALIVVLAVVFFVVRSSGGDETPAASAPAASAPAAAPAEAAQEPAEPDVAIDPRLQKEPVVTAGKGAVKALKVTPLIAGRGPKVAVGQTLTVNYTGVTYKDGKVFDSSWQRGGQPVTFPYPIGVGQLIKGWDEGLIGVPVGSRVQLDIPSDKAYGDNPEGGRPPGDLRFVVDVLKAS